MSMKRLFVVGAMVWLAGQTVAFAQPETIVRALPARAIGMDSLSKFLRDLDYAPKSLSPDVFQITREKDRWPVYIMVSLSTDARRVWFESKFSPIERPEKVAAQAWLKLLEANEKIGPAHFAFDREDRRVHLYKSIDNVDVDAERLRREIEAFDNIVRKTQDYWKAENFKASEEAFAELPVRKSLPVIIPPADPVVPGIITSREKETDQSLMTSKWKIVEIEVKGQKTPANVIENRQPSLEIKDCKAGLSGTLKTGPDSERMVRVKIDSAAIPVREIDFIDERDQVEKGIYKFDGDTLVLCFAAPGEARPTEFRTQDSSRNWLIVLKKVK